MKMLASQFRNVMTQLCQRHHIPDYTDSMVARYWPAFSHLEEEGQHAFLEVVLGTTKTPQRATTAALPERHMSEAEDNSGSTPHRQKSHE